MVETLGVGAVVSALLGANVFFIKRLVDKLDKTACVANQAVAAISRVEGAAEINRQGLISAKHEFREALIELKDDVHESIERIQQDLKEARRLEVDVAVVKSLLSGVSKKVRSDT